MFGSDVTTRAQFQGTCGLQTTPMQNPPEKNK
uniref:Uncharacterized protein n=1 Tax=Anguilla anguilla TaxID=7936 RepID=A0A0E9SMQ1_ANGAN